MMSEHAGNLAKEFGGDTQHAPNHEQECFKGHILTLVLKLCAKEKELAVLWGFDLILACQKFTWSNVVLEDTSQSDH